MTSPITSLPLALPEQVSAPKDTPADAFAALLAALAGTVVPGLTTPLPPNVTVATEGLGTTSPAGAAPGPGAMLAAVPPTVTTPALVRQPTAVLPSLAPSPHAPVIGTAVPDACSAEPAGAARPRPVLAQVPLAPDDRRPTAVPTAVPHRARRAAPLEPAHPAPQPSPVALAHAASPSAVRREALPTEALPTTVPAPFKVPEVPQHQAVSTVHVRPALLEAARGLKHEGGGRTSLVIRLDPPELGAVLVRLTVQDGRVDVQLRTPDLAARSDLQAQSYDVQQVLREQGLDLASFDVAHGDVLSNDHGQAGTPDRGTRGDHGGADGRPQDLRVTDDATLPDASGTWL